MKNIHILPTDKPSGLSILNSGKLNFGAEIMSSSNSKPQHIYITSDEEIKEGDWYLNNGHLLKCTELKIRSSCKKIILTTDQDLIKDGVQSIDDEFLEWFVKNPSCQYGGYKDIDWDKIIIPKEELTISDVAKQIAKNYMSLKGALEPKQETLEEAAARHFNKEDLVEGVNIQYVLQCAFIQGANWQAKRMYSEEDVENILIEYVKTNPTKPYRVVSWFKQFKKK